MQEVEIGGVRFHLDPAAISAIRYRAEYGDSVLNHLSACATAAELEGALLRLVRMMIPPKERPALKELAKLARGDQGFFKTALEAKDALLAPDPLRTDGGEGDGEPFDEYQLLALMAAAGVDLWLVYELPLLHLIGVVGRCFEMKDTEHKDYHEMSTKELSKLYPR